jgi:hypothetical protein
MIQARKQISRSRIIIPFPGNYHVPDSIDWGSSSCPFLADARPAKRRRRERTIQTEEGGKYGDLKSPLEEKSGAGR